MNNNYKEINLQDLRIQWKQIWGIEPHNRIGRKMLEQSLDFKLNEKKLTKEEKYQLEKRSMLKAISD